MSEQDRRIAPRHMPVCDRLRVAWLEGQGQGQGLRRAEARLIDLSSSGAAVELDAIPPSPGAVWVGLEGTPHSEWMIADVLRVEPHERETWRVGIQFVRPCAVRFFRRAIWGLESEEDASPEPGSPRPEAVSPACWSERSRRAQDSIRRGADAVCQPLSGIPA